MDQDSSHYGLQTKIALDADDQATNLTRWQQTYDQLSPGRFEGRLTELWLDDMQIFCESTSHTVHQRCQVWENAIWFGIPRNAGQTAGIGSHLIGPQSIAARPGNVSFELVTPDQFEILGLVMELARVREHALQVEYRDVDSGWFERPTLDIGAGYRDAFSSFLSALLARVNQNEQILQHPAARRSLQSSLLTALFFFAGKSQNSSPAGAPTLADRHRLVARVREYVLSNSDQPPTVPDLCKKFHVSRRTLQYCFEQTLGTSPMQYLRAVRLNSVRRELRNRNSSFETVRDAAAAWGFWHLGQFASDYKSLFGERPSDSLRHRLHPAS